MAAAAAGRGARGAPGLARGVHGHRALHQVQLAADAHLAQRLGDHGPDLAQVLLAVGGEERGEGGLLEEGAALVVLRLELLQRPLVGRAVVDLVLLLRRRRGGRLAPRPRRRSWSARGKTARRYLPAVDMRAPAGLLALSAALVAPASARRCRSSSSASGAPLDRSAWGSALSSQSRSQVLDALATELAHRGDAESRPESPKRSELIHDRCRLQRRHGPRARATREEPFAICRFAATRSGGGGAAGARTSMRLHQAARVLVQRPKPRPIGPQRYGAPRPLVSRSGVATESLRRALAYLAILS